MKKTKKSKLNLPDELAVIESAEQHVHQAEAVNIDLDVEVEDDEPDTLDYDDEAFKKAQMLQVKSEIEICVENFELLALKYRPVILSNIRKIHKMYLNYPQIEFDDLYQEGLIALYQSIENFDNTRGIFFGVYLKVAIANKLKCFCRNFLPHRYVKDEAKSIEKGKTEFKRLLINVGTLDDAKSYLL